MGVILFIVLVLSPIFIIKYALKVKKQEEIKEEHKQRAKELLEKLDAQYELDEENKELDKEIEELNNADNN